MILTISFFILALLTSIALVVFLFFFICRMVGLARKKANLKQITRMKKAALFFVIPLVINAGLVAISQITASTPVIRDESGNIPENSIAELTQIELNGRKQWICIRGLEKSKPILLFLAGGPGGSQMAAVRHELSELEKYFVVVGWDQPGSGKSYYAESIKDITIETYIQDGQKLTEYLTKRFGKEKIFLVGESWGSALGIFLADRYSEYYHAFIGTGQMIDFAETECMDYKKAMEIAEENGDTEIIKKLEENGVPPYYGKDVTWKSAVYLNYLSDYMAGNPDIFNSGYNTFRDMGSSEYGILDKINYARGIINTFNHVYQQLYTIDMRKDYLQIDVPVYFFLGRHDINAPASLAEEYMEVLSAPKKEIVWFEHSGHNPWLNERQKFIDELIARFLFQ